MAIPRDAQGNFLTRNNAIGALLNYFQGADKNAATTALNDAFTGGSAKTANIQNLLRQAGVTDPTYQLSQIQNAIDQIAPFEKDPNTAIQSELKDIRSKDYAGLSDPELADVQKRLQFLSELSGSTVPRVTGATTPVGPGGITGPNSTSYEDQALGIPDVGIDLTSVGGLIDSRQKQAASQAQVNSLINSLPDELARGRNEFYNSQIGQGQQFFNESLSPGILQSLNARGILNSGDLENELNRGASGIQSGIESSLMGQQSADDAFFQNAAYQQTFQNEIQAGQDLSGQLQNQRGQALQNQQFGFQRIQADLNRQYQDMITSREQQRQVTQAQQQYEQQRQLQNQQNQAGYSGAIGSAIGGIGGALIGSSFGPIGTGIGYSAGQNFGQGLSRITS